MGLRITGAVEVEEMFSRVDTTAKRRVLRELFAAGKRLQNLAIRMAPVDKGNLESAIKMEPEQPGRVRDALGRFQRQEIEVYIDFMVDAGGGHTVGDYAYEVHEHMFPYGYGNRGPRTLAKQASESVTVGGGFLERAAEAVEKELDKKVDKLLDDLF